MYGLVWRSISNSYQSHVYHYQSLLRLCVQQKTSNGQVQFRCLDGSYYYYCGQCRSFKSILSSSYNRLSVIWYICWSKHLSLPALLSQACILPPPQDLILHQPPKNELLVQHIEVFLNFLSFTNPGDLSLLLLYKI
jgi:hypothetical protein